MQNAVAKKSSEANGQNILRIAWPSHSESRGSMQAIDTASDEIEYVLHEPEGSQEDIFEDYYSDE